MTFKSLRGFTLLEMLVVLVLVGLISTLLMHGFSYVLQLRVRFLAQLEDHQTGALQEHWFRSVTATLTPDQVDGEHVFQGVEDRFQGLSLSPLRTDSGIPVPIAWELIHGDNQTSLQYRENDGQPWRILRWSGREGGFHYLDDEGRWHRQWPPALGIVPSQLPAGILLQAQRRGEAMIWLVAPQGRRVPKRDLRDWLDG